MVHKDGFASIVLAIVVYGLTHSALALTLFGLCASPHRVLSGYLKSLVLTLGRSLLIWSRMTCARAAALELP